MKVLLLNGSRREKGCTYTALSIVAEALGKHGIDTEIIHALPTDDAVSEVAEDSATGNPLSTYLLPRAYQAPRSVRFMVQYDF